MTTHLIDRTSPMGQDFIGKCRLCGQTNLRMIDAQKACLNPQGITSAQSIILALEDDTKPIPGEVP